MRAMLIATPAYELAVDIDPTPYGYSFSLSGFVPTGRRPEIQRRVQATLSRNELLTLRRLIDDVLTACSHIQPERTSGVSVTFPVGKGPTAASLSAYHMSVARRQKREALQKIADGEQEFSLSELKSLAAVICDSLSIHANTESE